MYNDYKIKLIREKDVIRISKHLKRKYYEIRQEPTFGGDYILLCSKKNFSFKEIIDIIMRPKNKKHLLLAMSFLYYQYFEQYYEFFECSDEKTRKCLYNRTRKYFKKWYSLCLGSDTFLYPQNILIIKFVEEYAQKSAFRKNQNL